MRDKRKKVLLIGGARPNFMKIAPLFKQLKRYDDEVLPLIVHTGQHYDVEMSDAFFKDFDLPEPDYYMGVGSGTHAEQTANVMMKIECLCLDIRPDCVVVVGDVNSTMAAALAASKLNIKIAHVEAGLRSKDRTMPEEINRIVTDALSDLLFTTSIDANDNLKKEGVTEDKIVFVGNIMIDALVSVLEKVQNIEPPIKEPYGIVTLHRPSNVDDVKKLKELVGMLVDIARDVQLVFPVHPRTRKALQNLRLIEEIESHDNIHLCEPQGYLMFVAWMKKALFSLTDSGGIQEETTYLGIPCFTLRKNTERPITITQGTNQLITNDTAPSAIRQCISGGAKQGGVPDLWDGRAAERIVSRLINW